MTKLFFPLAVCLVLFAGCATSRISTMEFTEMKSLALLSDSSLCLKIPVSAHSVLVEDILSRRFLFDDEIVHSLTERISVVYIGLESHGEKPLLQISATVAIPKLVLNSVLQRKNGWSKEWYFAPLPERAIDSNRRNSFKIYLHNSLQISFPARNLLSAAADVRPMLDHFTFGYGAEPEIKSWIMQKSTDILFYISNPAQYLENLRLHGISINAAAIYGRFSLATSDQYELSFNVLIADIRAISAIRMLLSISFSNTGASVKQTSEDILTISGIKMSVEDIENMIFSDSIIGH